MAAPIVHLEFLSADFGRTAAFYGELFGWQTQQNANGSYMKLEGAEGATAGCVRTDTAQSPGPLPYLQVDDLAATLAKIERAGGRVLARRLPFAGGGEIALFADPDGNVIGLWMRKKGEAKGDGKPSAKAKVTDDAAKPPKAAPKASAARKPAKPSKR
jgi:predicted enzyme related to lactoylglutathione lyase